MKKLIDTARALEGMPRHASTHAAGVVITKRPVVDYVPLATNDDAVGCQYVMPTLEELGLYALLSGHNTVFSHWHLPEGGDAASLRAQAAGSEHYLLSANGIAETGEIINIDGADNRVASAIYGHKKVWIIAGKNKLAPTYDEALWRARNIAAPKNAQRLHAKTPCAVRADHCYDCKSPGRICRALTVLWGAMMGSDMEVVLVN